jgi:hypothetical protein
MEEVLQVIRNRLSTDPSFPGRSLCKLKTWCNYWTSA